MPSQLEMVQNELKKKDLFPGPIDGQLTGMTVDSLNILPERYPDIKPDWPPQRKALAFLQIVCLEAGFDPHGIDGLWGHNTENAIDNYQYFLVHGKAPDVWRPEDISDVNPNNWPKQYTAEFDNFFGPHGDSNLVRFKSPYPMRIAWDTGKTVNSFSCHAKVQESMGRVLNKVLNFYGLEEIQRLNLDMWGGCFNERPLRGGSNWSMHSWGIAVDFDPDRNKLKMGRDQAEFASSEYNKWWEFWEEEGWVSLGRLRNFDWMHIQAAKL